MPFYEQNSLIKKIIDLFLKLKYYSSFNILISFFSLNIIAQIILSISNLVNAKIFTPNLIGNYTIFTTFLNIFSVFSAFKLHEALVVSKSKNEEIYLYNISILFIFFTSIISIPILYLYKNYYLSSQESLDYLLLLPLYIFIQSLQILSFSFLVKTGSFNFIGKIKILSNFVIFLLNLLFFKVFPEIIFFSLLISLLISYIVLEKTYCHLKILNLNISKNNIKKSLFHFKKKYINYLKYYVPSSLVNKISYGLPFLILPKFFSHSWIAFLTYAYLLTFGISGILGQTFQQFFFYKNSYNFINSKKSFHVDFLKQFKIVFILSIILHLALFSVIPSLVLFLLGNQWKDVIPLARSLCFWSMFVLVNTSLSSIFVITNNHSFIFKIESLGLFIRFFVLIFSVYNYDIFDVVFVNASLGLLYELCLSFAYIQMSMKVY